MKKAIGLTLFIAIFYNLATIATTEYHIVSENVMKFVTVIILGGVILNIRMRLRYKFLSFVAGFTLGLIFLELSLEYLP